MKSFACVRFSFLFSFFFFTVNWWWCDGKDICFATETHISVCVVLVQVVLVFIIIRSLFFVKVFGWILVQLKLLYRTHTGILFSWVFVIARDSFNVCFLNLFWFVQSNTPSLNCFSIVASYREFQQVFGFVLLYFCVMDLYTFLTSGSQRNHYMWSKLHHWLQSHSSLPGSLPSARWRQVWLCRDEGFAHIGRLD